MALPPATRANHNSNWALSSTALLNANLPSLDILNEWSALAWPEFGAIILLRGFDMPLLIEQKWIESQTPMYILHNDLTWTLIHEVLHLQHMLTSTRDPTIEQGKQRICMLETY